jgi:nucleoside-triphosphatase THEP1
MANPVMAVLVIVANRRSRHPLIQECRSVSHVYTTLITINP